MDDERNYIVVVRWKDGTSKRIGTFTARNAVRAIALAKATLTEEQKQNVKSWETEVDFL